ncbi:hypothetical protein PR202_gb11697 [Eleusine coracana subsp. coracana]|uniref:F-box associated domain-containing protein n=1 Tax=Eleusine coracana subsp. coracana TaxID=191504 RepID=A0AAV5ENL1_ELECO|nr:hypothetical protein PR202_gb11697 [Eleusine coracana subsp. coracana]
MCSHRLQEWHERSFVRQGDPVGTVADRKLDYIQECNMIYWRGAVYVHMQDDFVMRISLSNDTYQVIKPPRGIACTAPPSFYLGKSKRGVYCAAICCYCERLDVWILEESSCKMEWVLIHQRSLVEWLINKHDPRVSGPWSLQNLNYCYGKYNIEDDVEADMCEEKWEWSSEASVSEKFEWSSDDCNVDQCKNNSYENYRGYYTEILGFHPYKEIIFLSEITTRGLAYNFNSSEVQVLGDIYPLRYRQELLNDQFIMSSFAYTPCLMEM